MLLTHVRPLDDPLKETNAFLRFNLPLQMLRYDAATYQRKLRSDDWTKEETDALMELAERFDARLVVVHDRWQLRPRSLEEIKVRSSPSPSGLFSVALTRLSLQGSLLPRPGHAVVVSGRFCL